MPEHDVIRLVPDSIAFQKYEAPDDGIMTRYDTTGLSIEVYVPLDGFVQSLMVVLAGLGFPESDLEYLAERLNAAINNPGERAGVGPNLLPDRTDDET